MAGGPSVRTLLKGFSYRVGDVRTITSRVPCNVKFWCSMRVSSVWGKPLYFSQSVWPLGSEPFIKTVCPLECWLVLIEINSLSILTALILLFEKGLLSHHDILKLLRAYVIQEEINSFRDNFGNITDVCHFGNLLCTRIISLNIQELWRHTGLSLRLLLLMCRQIHSWTQWIKN